MCTAIKSIVLIKFAVYMCDAMSPFFINHQYRIDSVTRIFLLLTTWRLVLHLMMMMMVVVMMIN